MLYYNNLIGVLAMTDKSLVDKILEQDFPDVAGLSDNERLEWNLDRENKNSKIKREISLKIHEAIGTKPKSDDDHSYTPLEDNLFNVHSIEIHGARFGWGWFYWNEYNLSYKGNASYLRSLYDIDREEAAYQFSAMHENEPARSRAVNMEEVQVDEDEKFNYDKPNLHYWLRTKRGETIEYLTIISLSSWIAEQIENEMYDYMEKRYEWSFKAGPHDRERSGKNNEFIRWDKEPWPADPELKEEFDAASEISREYERNEGYDEIRNEIKDNGIRGCVMFETDPGHKHEKNYTLVVADVETLKEINPKTFYDDIDRVQKKTPIDIEAAKAKAKEKVAIMVSKIEELRSEDENED